MLKRLSLILLLITLLLNTSTAQDLCITQTKADSLVVSIHKAELYKELSFEQDLKIKNLESYAAVSDSVIKNKDTLYKVSSEKYRLCEEKRVSDNKQYKLEKFKAYIVSGSAGLIIGFLVGTFFWLNEISRN